MAITEARAADPSSPNPQRLVAKGWVQGVALVMLFGFFVMGVLAFRTYTDSMPLPKRILTSSGQVLLTDADSPRARSCSRPVA